MITKKDLEEYYYLSKEIDEIEKEIAQQWNTYHSPSMEKIGSRPLSSSDPTASAVRRIEELEEILRDKQEKLRAEVIRIEEWMDDINNHEISSIVRCKYVLRMSWREVAVHVYGNSSASAPRKRLNRYFKNRM